jgi:alanine racemase
MSGFYHIGDIAESVGGKLFLKNKEFTDINDILIDSRKLISTHNNLFIALKSDRNDGKKFIKELFNKGVYNFIVNKLEDEHAKLNANFIVVGNTLKALQDIGTFHRNKFNIPIIGISGSNGKTIVKEWLYQCLMNDYSICRSPKSYNSQIGVPLSVFQLNKTNTLGIFEAGISEPDEMLYLENIIKPDIGIFTNIGTAHSQQFVDIRQKINEKLKLFVKSKVLIFGRDYGDIAERIYNLEIFKKKILLDWSRKNKDAAFYISSISHGNNNSTINGIWQNNEISYTIPFIDNASIENSISVCVLLLHLGFDENKIQEKLAQLSPIAMRMELKGGINNCTVINDSYNSDLNALSIALDFLLQQQQHSKKTVILSDILQSGKTSNELYKEVAQLLITNKITKFIGIGKNLLENKSLFNLESYFYKNTDDFLAYFPLSSFSNETILLKGARDFEFERINNALGKKTHQTRLEVNLNAMLENYNYFRSIIEPNVKIMIMVKAFSYGSGSFEVANLLQFHQADYLAVAYADEGIELRKAGISLPIMVMNPEFEALESIIIHQIEPEIYSFKILNELESILINRAHPLNKPIGIHIKIDTGMHRLGFMQNDIDELIERLKSNPKIIIKSIFSHLAASDSPDFDEFTQQQISIYQECSSKIQNAFNYSITRHIANSAAITRFPQAQYDMVRLGIGIYGVASDINIQNNLQIVTRLKSIISQIKNIKKGDSVGYNRAFVAEKDMKIATIPIGYADGFDRRFSQGKASVVVNGVECKIIGNVCMDMCMIDLGNIEASEGDEVIIFGDKPSIQDLAKSIGSIPYEILTSISSRVKRVYIQE